MAPLRVWSSRLHPSMEAGVAGRCPYPYPQARPAAPSLDPKRDGQMPAWAIFVLVVPAITILILAPEVIEAAIGLVLLAIWVGCLLWFGH